MADSFTNPNKSHCLLFPRVFCRGWRSRSTWLVSAYSSLSKTQYTLLFMSKSPVQSITKQLTSTLPFFNVPHLKDNNIMHVLRTAFFLLDFATRTVCCWRRVRDVITKALSRRQSGQGDKGSVFALLRRAFLWLPIVSHGCSHSSRTVHHFSQGL